MPDDRTWSTVREMVYWSMTNGSSNPEGRERMRHAAHRGDLKFLDEFKEGFRLVHQTHPVRLKQFEACAADNPAWLYNTGRVAMGLPPV